MQRMLEQNELLAEEIDRWIGSDMQSSRRYVCLQKAPHSGSGDRLDSPSI